MRRINHSYPDQYQGGYDALRCMIDFSSYSMADLAMSLVDAGYWPGSLGYESATAKFRACMNPEKEAFFKSSEIQYLMFHTGRCDPLYYDCDRLGLERPRAVPKGISLQAIQDGIESLQGEISVLQNQITDHLNRESRNTGPVTVIGRERQLRWCRGGMY